ncbi:dihydropteroate synthase [bacterium]|nr:dihydropteroate synthase [bacterium]
MGILNVTPDSFSDGGKFIDLDLALQHAYKMVEEGADIIDIGGESSRPGATAVDKNDELARVIPLIQALSSNLDIPLSIDTCKSDVAEAAINAGADIVNDISALSADEGMADVISRLGVPAVLMHMKGTPGTMQSNPHYDDMLGEIFASLQSSIDYAISVGVERNQLIIDPGIGFGKLIPDNFVLLRRLKEFSAIGCPILVGASRKSFIGWALNKPETQRLSGSLAAAVAATLAGAHILRVHDVAASREAVEIAWQIKKSQQVNAGNEQWI